MRIVFDATTLHQSKSGSVTGVVYFDFGPEQKFPVACWNDFVVVIAGWWLAALDTVARAKPETVLRFMDGPFRVTAVPQERSRVLLRCTEDRHGAGVVHEVVVEVADLVHELTSFAQAVSRACATAGIESADVANLRKMLPN